MRRLAVALGLLFAVTAVPAHAVPRCFGAAGRLCTNPALRLVVRPGYQAALITPNEYCRVTGLIGHPPGRVKVCEFGVPVARARHTVALLGDSHAMAWRAAVTGAARRLGWHGVNLTRSHCPFSFARRALGRRDTRGCARFNHRVLRYLRRHRSITAVVVAHQSYGSPYAVRPPVATYGDP